MSIPATESLRHGDGASPLYIGDTTSPLPDISRAETIWAAQRSGRVGRAACEGCAVTAVLDIDLDEPEVFGDDLDEGIDPEDLDPELFDDFDDGEFDMDPEDPPIPEEEFVDIPDACERDRLRGRYYMREHDTYMNHDKPMVLGPECETLYPYLVTDPYRYKSMLESVELREMIASTALAVLDDADTFTTIVGEDTSGRIPALILGKAINIVRQRHGLAPARRLFVSGRIATHAVPNYSAYDESDRALLITEYICSGTSVNDALAALRRVGFVDPSAATLDRQPRSDYIHADSLYMGNSRSYTDRADMHLYGLPSQLKGVRKESGDPHSTRAPLKRKERKRLVRSRREFDHFAREIVDIWTVLRDGPTD